MTPPSACPTCHSPIAPWDNIPVLSWLVLRGRCRNCQAPISARYPLVELATAGLFAGTAARFGYQWDVPAFLVLFAGLLALSYIDVERLLLPKKIVYPLLGMVAALLVMAAAATGQWHDLLVATLCALGWFILFFGLNAVSPRTARIRRCPPGPGSRTRSRLARRALRPAGLLRGQPHRRDHRHRARSRPNGSAGRNRFPTGSSWPSERRWPFSPDRSCCNHSASSIEP